MSSIFTKIIEGTIPGRLIWRDEQCVSMVDIRPLARGHCLVIPIAEVDRWTDLPSEVATHLMGVAHAVATAQQSVFQPARVGLMIAGFEVPHTHLHVVPLASMADLDFANADANASGDDLDEVASVLRAALRASGADAVVDA